MEIGELMNVIRHVANRIAVIPVAAAFAASAFAVILPSHAAETSPAAAVESFMLDNGLKTVVIPDNRAPVVTHMLWYKAGSADEPPGKSGIAHFLEHLMFKGTDNHSAGEFSTMIAELGGQENAFTSSDYTAYFQKVPPSALKDVMAMEADRMRNLVLTDEVVAPEREVILEERASRVDNEPGAIMSEELQATLYQNHPYRNPVIGWKHEMEQLSREDAIAFYDRYYKPSNAVLVVAGNVTRDEVRALAVETYGKIPRGNDAPPRIRPSEPEQNTARTVTLHDPRVTRPSFRASWIVPSYRTSEDGEAVALDLLGEILGGGVRSRVYQELVVNRGIASSVGAYYQGTSHDETSFTIYGTPRGGATLEEVETGIVKQIAKIAEEGVTDDELEKAKKRFVRAMIFARDDQSSMARIYGSTLTTGGTVEDIAKWPDEIRAVTPDQVQNAARKYLDMSRAAIGYLLPEDEVRG